MLINYFCLTNFPAGSSENHWTKTQTVSPWLFVLVVVDSDWLLAPLSRVPWSPRWLSWSSSHCPFVTVFKLGPALHHVTAKLTPPPPLFTNITVILYFVLSVKLVKSWNKIYLFDDVGVKMVNVYNFSAFYILFVIRVTLQKVSFILWLSRPKHFQQTASVSMCFSDCPSPVRGSKSSMTSGNHAS